MSAPSDFWSRRKQAVEVEAKAEEAKLQVLEEERVEAVQEQKTDTEILDDLGLQDPDTLEKGDDFTAFMAKAVPTRLRNRALRKLWLSDPALANLDTLLDYGEDFSVSERALEDFQTAYQVGKGFAARVLDIENTDKDNDKAEDLEMVLDDGQDLEEPALDFELEQAETTVVDTVVLADEDDCDDDVQFVAKKRMRFVIEAQV